MGKKARLKKLRNQVTAKLKSMGLEDTAYFVVSKEIPYKKPVLDAKGESVKDENGADKFTIEKFQRYTAKNPLRALQRKIMHGDVAEIEKFVKE